MKRQSIWRMFALGTAAALFVACGPPVENGGEPVDHETTQQSLEHNTKTLSKRISSSVQFIENSTLATDGLSMYSESDCAVQSGGSQPGGSQPCASGEVEIETDMSEQTSEAIKLLKAKVFNRDHIVASSEKSITYRVPGKTICGEEPETLCEPAEGASGGSSCSGSNDSSWHDECVKNANKMKYRIRVTSPSNGDLDFEFLIGSDDLKPGTLELHDNHVAVIADLGQIKKTIKYADDIYDNNAAQDLPSTMKGVIRAQLESDGPKHAHFETKIEAGVSIGGGDYGLDLARAAKPVFGVTADADKRTLTSTVDFGAIEATFPSTYYDSNGSGGSTETILQHTVHLAGLSAQAKYVGNSDEVQFTNIGIGDATSWLKMAGKKVLSADLNPANGRQFNVTVKPGKNGEGIQFDVEPNFDLQMDFNFGRIKNKLSNFNEFFDKWTEDESIRVRLSGGNPASVVATDEEVKIRKGKLEISSKNPSKKVTVQAGQCLGDSQSSSTGGSTSSYHPVDDLEATMCAAN